MTGEVLALEDPSQTTKCNKNRPTLSRSNDDNPAEIVERVNNVSTQCYSNRKGRLVFEKIAAITLRHFAAKFLLCKGERMQYTC